MIGKMPLLKKERSYLNPMLLPHPLPNPWLKTQCNLSSNLNIKSCSEETLFDLPEETISVNIPDAPMVTDEDTATFQGTDSALKDFMAKSPLKRPTVLPDQFPSPEPLDTMEMEVDPSEIEMLEKKRSLRKSRNSFSPTQASLQRTISPQTFLTIL
jgi:hypothetical protein